MDNDLEFAKYNIKKYLKFNTPQQRSDFICRYKKSKSNNTQSNNNQDKKDNYIIQLVDVMNSLSKQLMSDKPEIIENRPQEKIVQTIVKKDTRELNKYKNMINKNEEKYSKHIQKISEENKQLKNTIQELNDKIKYNNECYDKEEEFNEKQLKEYQNTIDKKNKIISELENTINLLQNNKQRNNKRSNNKEINKKVISAFNFDTQSSSSDDYDYLNSSSED